MIGYITSLSSDGTYGGITAHGDIVRDLYGFQPYAGTPLALEMRVSFGLGTTPNSRWANAVNVSPVLDGNGNPLFDNDGRVH